MPEMYSGKKAIVPSRPVLSYPKSYILTTSPTGPEPTCSLPALAVRLGYCPFYVSHHWQKRFYKLTKYLI